MILFSGGGVLNFSQLTVNFYESLSSVALPPTSRKKKMSLEDGSH